MTRVNLEVGKSEANVIGVEVEVDLLNVEYNFNDFITSSRQCLYQLMRTQTWEPMAISYIV